MAARPPPMAEPEGGAPFRPLLRKKGAMTGLQTTSAEQSFRHLMTKGEALHPERFGGGFCCAGRTIPRSNGSSLVCMASLGKLQEVKARVERQGEDVNSKDANGETALAAAAGNGDTDMCSYLISRGAEVLTKGPGGMTALHYAARSGHAEIVHLLCNTADFYRPDLDIKTSDGWTALHVASRERQGSVVSYLVFATSRTELFLEIMEVDVDARTHDGRTPLMICAENCFLHGAQMLLEGGANAGLVCWEHQYSALHLAALAADPHVLELLIAHGEAANEAACHVDAPAAGGWTPLMLAASCGHTEAIKALLKHGADVMASTDSGSVTPLGAAMLSEEEEAIAIIRSALERAECAELAEEVPRGAAHA